MTSNNFLYVNDDILQLLEQQKSQKKLRVKNIEQHLYLISSIYNLHQKERTISITKNIQSHEYNYVNINFNTLNKIIKKRTQIKKIKEDLISLNLIECDNSYSKEGGKSLGYKINPIYMQSTNWDNIQIEGSILNKNILKVKQERKKRYRDIEPKLYSDLERMYIQTEYAINHLKLMLDNKEISLDGFNSIKHSILMIDARELYMVKDKNGRIHSNITNLKSEIRDKFIFTVDEDGVICDKKTSTDISQSQVRFFLACVLKNRVAYNIDSYDIDRLTHMVTFSDVYNHFSNKKTRRQKKNDFFFFLYGKLSQVNFSDVAKKFKKQFPSVYNFIIEYKKDFGYEALANLMQKQESTFMFKKVLPRFDFNTITVHDSIIYDTKYTNVVEKAMEEEFALLYEMKIGLETKELNVLTEIERTNCLFRSDYLDKIINNFNNNNKKNK